MKMLNSFKWLWIFSQAICSARFDAVLFVINLYISTINNIHGVSRDSFIIFTSSLLNKHLKLYL